MMWTALLMGLGGSLHCAGMCSPLALSVTVFSRNVVINRLLYNGGRIFIYGLLGAIVATFGSLFHFDAFQTILSVSMGALLILIGLGTISNVHIPIFTKSINKLILFIKKHFATLMKHKNYSGLVFMGMLNGLLPCGLTYLTLSYTLTLDSTMEGFLFMLVFGLGTFPVMVGLPFVIQFINRYLRIKVAKLTTVMMIGLGVLLIGRTLLVHNHPESHPTVSVREAELCR